MPDKFLNAKELTEDDLDRWMDRTQASSVGRGFSMTSERDQSEFREWFLKVYNEALETRDG